MVRPLRYVPLGMMVAAVVGNSRSARGAGFQVSEPSVVRLGRSLASAGIVRNDLSAVSQPSAGLSADAALVDQRTGSCSGRADLLGVSARLAF